MDRDFPLPCVCQKTPPLPSFAAMARSTQFIALLTAKYWW